MVLAKRQLNDCVYRFKKYFICISYGISHSQLEDKARLYCYHKGTRLHMNVCSFILDYIKLQVPDEVKHLILFSDSCTGKNKTILRLGFL